MALASSKDGGLDPLEFSLACDIVELLVLTVDEVFLQTLRGAVGGSRRLWHVPSPHQVSDLLVAGQVGILVLDVQALHETAGVFVSEIKRQFPDLVVVVAGDRGAEMLLANLISVGSIYRFIHKPMSPARARLFADAAVKRYEEQRHRTVRTMNQPPAMPLARRWLIVAACCMLTTAAGAWWFQQRSREARRAQVTPVTSQSSASPLLTRAAAALAANRLSPPAADNALELYLQALARNPSDAAARAGLTEVHERLLARAENALLEERLDEAAAAIQIARRAGVESGRIALLTAQLARSRSLVKSQRSSTASKNDASAEMPASSR